MERISSIAVFVKVAETLSFVAAGRELGLTASAVGKSIARLEQDLGVRLFQRSTRRVSLTEDGQLFHRRCRAILDDLQDARAELSQTARAPKGRLKISLPTIGYRFLLPCLPEFRRRYPEVELELDFNDRIVDLIEGGYDAVIRSGDLPDSSLMARRLGPYRFQLCASPAYLEHCGVPATPSDLRHYDGLRFRFPTSGKLQPWGTLEDQASALRSNLVCNNMEALRGAAIEGLGIAYMPDFLAKDALSAGSLRCVLEDHIDDEGQFWIVWPSSRQLTTRLRAFVDFAAERLFSG